MGIRFACRHLAVLLACMLALAGGADARNTASVPAQAGSAPAPAYVLEGTEVHAIPAPSLGRDYDIFVSFPESYATSQKRYPVVFVLDANYAFPLTRSLLKRVGDHGNNLQECILIGLSYAKGDSPSASRNRDYTPTDVNLRKTADKEQAAFQYGQAEGYRQYLQKQVFPYVEQHFRADMSRKIFLGHSYGSLFAAHVLFTEPTMFQQYILGSPSLWFDKHVMLEREKQYAAVNKDLPAKIFMMAGSFERINPNLPRFNRTRDMVKDMLQFEETLKSRHYPGLVIHSKVVEDEDHLTLFPILATRGLLWALPAKSPGNP